MSSLEHGAGLDLCKLPEVARALDCTLTYLVGLTDDPERWEPDDAMWTATAPRAEPSRAEPLRADNARGAELPWILGPLDPTRKSRA